MENMKGILVKDEAFYKRKKQSIDELMQIPEIIALLEKNHLNRDFVEANWIDFLNYAQDIHQCASCQGIDQCPKSFPGYHRELDIAEGQTTTILSICCYGAKVEEQRRVFSHITCNMPKDILLTSFQQLELNNEGNLIPLVRQLMNDTKKRPQKGIYLHGEMGIGKTYVMAAFCNLLAINLNDCAFISMPQLLQDLKGFFNSNEDNGLEHLMEVNYLIMDDLGAETLNAWGRDEVLYNLLNGRMLRKLPTYFTSVYDLKDLEAHYTLNKSRDEAIKVKRLMERITALSNDYELYGKRFR